MKSSPRFSKGALRPQVGILLLPRSAAKRNRCEIKIPRNCSGYVDYTRTTPAHDLQAGHVCTHALKNSRSASMADQPRHVVKKARRKAGQLNSGASSRVTGVEVDGQIKCAPFSAHYHLTYCPETLLFKSARQARNGWPHRNEIRPTFSPRSRTSTVPPALGAVLRQTGEGMSWVTPLPDPAADRCR
jgi:hypothetical protein